MKRIVVPLLASFALNSSDLPQDYALQSAPAFDPVLWNGSASNEELVAFYNRYSRSIEAIIDMEREKSGFDEGKLFSRAGHEKAERALFIVNTLPYYQAAYQSRLDTITAFSTYLKIPFREMTFMINEADRLNKSHGLRDKANCYTYAVNANHPDMPKDPRRLVTKNLSDTLDPQTFPQFIKDTINGSVREGLVFNGGQIKNNKGFYNVALLARPAKPNARDYYEGHEFHYLRQNPDGSWSHKYGPLNVTDIDFAGRKINNPETADFGNYRFIGYFSAPQGGIGSVAGIEAPKPQI